MKTRTSHITITCLRFFMILFWVYVALDKLWNLQNFHIALIRQPFPDPWAGILFWLLPLSELVLVILFSLHRFKIKKHKFFNPFLLSALILAVFTVYIGLGIVGLYTQKPCGCASVFIMGWYLTGPTAPMDRFKRYKLRLILFLIRSRLIPVPIYAVMLLRVKKYKMRFALFPAWPV